MFKITYKTNISDEALKDITLDYFNIEMAGEITGYILLEFNGSSSVGFYDEDINLDMFEELLVSWFELLNRTAVLLNHHDYVGLKLIENPTDWILFEKGGTNISVSYAEKRIVSRIENFTTTEKVNDVDKFMWSGVEIPEEEFRSVIVKATDQFIEHIRRINPNLLSSPSIIDLRDVWSANKKILE